MNRRLLAALVGIFAVGLLVGAAVGAAAVSDSSDGTAAGVEPDCDAATAVVDESRNRIVGIDESGADRTAAYFAAILAEQLAIIYVMEAEPTCFTLAERAGAAGFAGGLQVLAAAERAAPAGTGAPTGADESGEPVDSGE